MGWSLAIEILEHEEHEEHMTRGFRIHHRKVLSVRQSQLALHGLDQRVKDEAGQHSFEVSKIENW